VNCAVRYEYKNLVIATCFAIVALAIPVRPDPLLLDCLFMDVQACAGDSSIHLIS
jgi:hypothetical protein